MSDSERFTYPRLGGGLRRDVRGVRVVACPSGLVAIRNVLPSLDSNGMEIACGTSGIVRGAVDSRVLSSFSIGGLKRRAVGLVCNKGASSRAVSVAMGGGSISSVKLVSLPAGAGCVYKRPLSLANKAMRIGCGGFAGRVVSLSGAGLVCSSATYNAMGMLTRFRKGAYSFSVAIRRNVIGDVRLASPAGHGCSRNRALSLANNSLGISCRSRSGCDGTVPLRRAVLDNFSPCVLKFRAVAMGCDRGATAFVVYVGRATASVRVSGLPSEMRFCRKRRVSLANLRVSTVCRNDASRIISSCGVSKCAADMNRGAIAMAENDFSGAFGMGIVPGGAMAGPGTPALGRGASMSIALAAVGNCRCDGSNIV